MDVLTFLATIAALIAPTILSIATLITAIGAWRKSRENAVTLKEVKEISNGRMDKLIKDLDNANNRCSILEERLQRLAEGAKPNV